MLRQGATQGKLLTPFEKVREWEIRNSNIEIRNKFKIPMGICSKLVLTSIFCLELYVSVIRYCFEFHASIFEFESL
jgi:hypothetical protein